MAKVTEDWSPRERELFTELLGRFNIALADWHSGFGQRGEPDRGEDIVGR